MPSTILAVDDSRISLDILGQSLVAAGHLVLLSTDGAEALDLAAGRGFDAIILDMVMPGINGLQVLAELRGARETADVPVMMLTASNDPTAAIRALAAGADDHLAKPFTPDILIARLARMLDRSRRIAELKRANAALDARIATRAIELGEARATIAALTAQLARLNAGAPIPG
jgi:DNA-binding response OmpR family regulator